MDAFVFPGQGSQRRGMGQRLFDEVREYTSVEPEIDSMLGYSLRDLCLQDRGNQLQDTRYTQPAVYVVNALHYFKELELGRRADFLAGHSLGEYNALLAAGAFDLLTGLRLVTKRAELMSQARGGGMAAVVGLDQEEVEQLLERNGLSDLDIANANTPVQFVISGPLPSLERVEPVVKRAGATMFLRLPVGGAFHSRYMNTVSRSFEEFLAPLEFGRLRTSVIANVTGDTYPESDTASMKALLVRQIREPVRWTQSIRYLLGKGVTTFKELGGTVLTGLIRQIRNASVTGTPG